MHKKPIPKPSSTSKLIDVLRKIKDYPWNYGLFLKGKVPWSSNALSAVLDFSEYDTPEENPPFAVKHKLKHALNIHQVQEVVANAKSQKHELTDEDLINAFNFYYKHDAFIDFAPMTKV